MADEDLTQKMELMRQEQAQHDARIKQIEEIILQFTRGTRDRFEGTDKRVEEIFSRLAQDTRDRLEASDKRFDELVSCLAQGTRDRFQATDKRVDDIFSRLAQGTQDRFEATDKRLDGNDNRLDDVDVKIAALVDSQIHTEQIVKETAEAVRNLSASVDRYLKGRNGGSGASTNPHQ